MSELSNAIAYPLRDASLPQGWASATVGELVLGIRPGFASGEHNKVGAGIPHIRPMNISREGELDLSEIKYVSPDNPLRLCSGDVLFNNTNSPALVGKTTAITSEDALAFSNHMTRLTPAPGVSNRFLARQLHFLWGSGFFRHLCVNHVNQASISRGLLSQVPITLASKEQQNRITAKIEELFSDLEAGVAALERARTKLKRYRAAVLKAAVEGRLTAGWRKAHPVAEPADKLLERILAEHRRKWEETQLARLRERNARGQAKYAAAGKTPPKGWKDKYPEPAKPDTSNLPALPEGWCWASFEQLISRSEYGTSVKCGYEGKHVAVLRIPNIIGGNIDLNDLKFSMVPLELEAGDQLSPGDLLMCRTNGSINLIGKSAVIRGKLDRAYSFASYLLRFRFVDVVTLPIWVQLFVNSRGGRAFIESKAASSAGQHNISLSTLHRMSIPLAPSAEQKAIVALAEERFSVVDKAADELELQLSRAMRLRQSILKRAFEGKLVPQDPNDEPASVLLERIRAARTAENPPRARKRRQAPA